MQPAELVQNFQQDGYIIVPIYSGAKLAQINAKIQEMILDYPEFGTSGLHPVMGGFGAHANPASFHHPTAQQVRLDVFDAFSRHFFPALAESTENTHWQMLFDRICSRSQNTPPVSGETWHYDTCDQSSHYATLSTTGGWVNLNLTEPQRFYAIKGLFGTDYTDGQGFSKLDSSLHPEFEQRLALQGGPITVPAGSMICFVPELVHKVCPGKTKHLDLRMYIGHAVMSSNRPLFDFSRARILSNLLPKIPSGQLPPVWSMMARSYRPLSIQDWTLEQQVHPQYVQNIVCGGTKHKGQMMRMVDRFMLHPVTIYEYSDATVRIMLPMRVSEPSRSKKAKFEDMEVIDLTE